MGKVIWEYIHVEIVSDSIDDLLPILACFSPDDWHGFTQYRQVSLPSHLCALLLCMSVFTLSGTASSSCLVIESFLTTSLCSRQSSSMEW